MKETIKKSLVWGLVFSLTSLTVFLVYATGVFNLPSTVWTGSWLSSAEWNKMVGSLEYLKTTNDSLQTQATNLQTQITTTNAKFTPEAWIAPTFQNWWLNYGYPYSTAWYFKDWFWIVHLKWIIRTWTVWASVFQLPIWYRPKEQNIFNISTYNWTYIIWRADVSIDWYVYINVWWNYYSSLDWISFRAEQ